MMVVVRLRILALVCLLLLAGAASAQYAPFNNPHQQFFDNNGHPLAGGRISTYTAGTLSPLQTYSDINGTPNTNPIVLDSGGFATIYLATASIYKFVASSSTGIQQWTQDNIQGVSIGGVDWTRPGTIGSNVPNTGQFTNINTTVMVTCPSCTDWGAALQSSYNSCPTNTAGYKSCLLVLPRVDKGPWLATFTNNSPAVCVQGQGETTSTFSYTGSGDAIRWNISPFVVTPACFIKDLSIAGTASGQSGIHVGDIISAAILRVSITGFTTGTGLWQDNVSGWTERYHWDDVSLMNNLYGWRLSYQGSNPLQQSHGYGNADLTLNVNAGQTGIRSEGISTYIYSGHFWTRGNSSGAINAWIDVEGTSNWDQNEFHIRGEGTVATNGIKVASGAVFRWYGDRFTPSMTTDTNANGATYGGTFRNVGVTSGNSSDAGIAANYAVSGIAGAYYPVALAGLDNPFGYYLVTGNNLASAGVVLFDSPGNAFAIQKLAFGAAPSTATTVTFIDKDGAVNSVRWNIDANFFAMMNGTNPIINFNPNTYLGYDRTNKIYQFYDGLGGVTLSLLQNGKVILAGTGSLWLGSNQVIDPSLNVRAASVIIGGTNTAPVVATPTVGQAACIYAAGPPVQIGKCTSVVGSTGGCTCAP